jgi:hypothetical protein
MGGFTVTVVYGFSRPTGDLDALEIIPQAAGLTMLELGVQGAPLHKEYKIYLDRVGVAKVPEEYESRLTEIFRKTFKHLRLFALDPYDRYPSWNGTGGHRGRTNQNASERNLVKSFKNQL